MADINAFYQEIERQMQSGTVQFTGAGEFGMPRLLGRISLERILLTDPVLSSLTASGFSLKGELRENLKDYDVLLTFSVSGQGMDCECLLEAQLRQEGELLLDDIYRTADFFASVNYYSGPFPLFDKMWVKKAVISADSLEYTETPLLSLWMSYEESCPLYRHYGKFLPFPGEDLCFQGNAEEPFGSPHYVIKASFLKEIDLPFYGGDKKAKACELVINSHAGSGGTDNEEMAYQCRAGVRFLVSVTGLPEEGVWFDIDFGSYGDVYHLYANFKDGMKIADAAGLIAEMTGQKDLPDLPEWAGAAGLPLKRVTMEIDRQMWREQDEQTEELTGCAFDFILDLPTLPIPFFDKAHGGAQAELTIQWGLLDIGASLSILAGFYGIWKKHRLKVNVELPSLWFRGIYDRNPKEAPVANGIFPAFMDLSVAYIRLSGSLRDNIYELAFELDNNNLYTLPIGAHRFQIDYIVGDASYSPKGLELNLSLEFTLFTAMIELEGNYYKEGEKQLLTLRGGLARPFSMAALVSLITGREVSAGSPDFTIDVLELVYRTSLSEEEADDSSPNVLGKPLYFEFVCAIAFAWGDDNRIASSFHLEWENKIYRLWISAGITLFDCFAFSASCRVTVNDGEFSFDSFEFATKIRSMEVTALYDANKNFTFKVVNFNLGELIEGLISLIAPDHNWYLPWPFHVLKQITLKELEVTIDRNKETIQAVYKINLKILILTVESIELFYNYQSGDFLVNVKTNASVGTEDVSRDGDSGEIYGLNILKDIFPPVEALGNKLFSLKYLGVGQHIQADIPDSFDEKKFPDVLRNVKKVIKKGVRPRLDADNNWVAALQAKFIDAVDVTLLMCDPSFYGLQIEIGAGSDLVAQLAGLSFTIIYSKVTETIGMFYARLKFPEAFRTIELGAMQLHLGEIGVWIYTNGNFKIDMGFPHNKDFSNSFGLTYLIFTGKGGFYFGLLNGDTSKAVPQVSKGHFEVVVELGIGISAGVGREISIGPLKAGAYVMMVAIFEGVLANYVPSGQGQKDSIYYKVKACAGVTASIYGSVDFVLIKVGFSVNASFMTELVLERYQPAQLLVALSVSVDAYIKILFIKISFSFRFEWEDSFVLGTKSTPPWEDNALADRERVLPVQGNCYQMQWYDEAVLGTKEEIQAEVVPYFTFDEPKMGETGSGQRKVAFLPLLHGLGEKTGRIFGYREAKETPFAILLKICLKRAVLSVIKTGGDSAGQNGSGEGQMSVNYDLLSWLYHYLSGEESFGEGFLFEKLERFLSKNVSLSYVKSEDTENIEIEGIPFVLYPRTELIWFSAPGEEKSYDLESEPMAGADFLKQMQEYYGQLSVWMNPAENIELMNGKGEKTQYSASTFLFMQYFYLLTKTVVSLAMEKIGEKELTPDEAAELVTDTESLKKAAGMVSRFCYGGNRTYCKDEGTKSLYAFALQEFDGLNPDDFEGTDIVHKMTMRIKSAQTKAEGIPDAGKRMQDEPMMPRLYQRSFAEVEFGNGEGAVHDGWEGIIRDGRSVAAESSLEWPFYKRDLVYPAGEVRMDAPVEILPFYRSVAKTEELTNPQMVAGEHGVSFWEIPSILSGSYQVTLHPEQESPEQIAFEKGFLLRLPIKESKKNIFSVEPVGYENINRITDILDDQVMKIEAYRYTNSLDEKNCGFARVEGPVYLYRNNLSLESEKPEQMQNNNLIRQRVEKNTEEKSYYNSAYLTETEQFLSLLKDASMVNSRGYYLRFGLADRSILDEGKMTLLLWVRTEKKSEAVKIDNAEITSESHPVILTGEKTHIYSYEAGTLAFRMNADVAVNGKDAEGTLQERYQMLTYRIIENDYFRESNESRPLIAQETERAKENQYSQVVPAYRMAKGDHIGPYGGVVTGSLLEMEFYFADLLGNRTADGKRWEISYGYTDPLLPVTAYPHTKCAYSLEKNENGYYFILTFQYVEEEENRILRLNNIAEGEEDKNIRIAYEQLNCADIVCAIDLCGKETVVEKAVLLDYVRALYEGKIPEDAAYILPFACGEKPLPIEVFFTLKRDADLLAESLKGTKTAEEVLNVRSTVVEDKEKINREYLARRGRDGQLFFVPPVSFKFGDCELWTLPPLSNKLHSFVDITVKDKEGKDKTASFYQVDLEEWADDFLKDMENFLMPDSLYGDDRDMCESLLAVKEKLADAISLGVMPVGTGTTDYTDRAVSYYKNLMMQNLHGGYTMDGVILLPIDVAPPRDAAWCVGAKADAKGLTLKPGKIKEDGVLPIGVRTKDVSRQMNVNGNLEINFTDWEITGEDHCDYLTIQKQTGYTKSINKSLPYKRFPGMPVLKEQGYAGIEMQERTIEEVLRNYSLWNYEIGFAHETAEQDILTLRLILSDGVRARNVSRGFLSAMAQYRYLREEFLKDSGLKDLLLRTCQDISDSWIYEMKETRLSMGKEHTIRFSLSFEKKKLQILQSDWDLKYLEIRMMNQAGEYEMLKREENDYILPDKLPKTCQFAFCIKNFDIRDENRINACLSVIRNQNIEGIDERFVYRTDEIRFADELCPFLRYGNTIDAGSFSRDNFTGMLIDISDGFGKMVLEAYCKAPVAAVNKETIYSYLPILYAPDIDSGKRTEMLGKVYERITGWLDAGFGGREETKKSLSIQLHLTLYAAGDEERRLVEFADISFLLCTVG